MISERKKIVSMSALTMASALEHFVNERITDKYIIVDIKEGTSKNTYKIRPLMFQDFLTNADGTQTVKCIDDFGRQIDIHLPCIKNRETEMAYAIIGAPLS